MMSFRAWVVFQSHFGKTLCLRGANDTRYLLPDSTTPERRIIFFFETDPSGCHGGCRLRSIQNMQQLPLPAHVTPFSLSSSLLLFLAVSCFRLLPCTRLLSHPDHLLFNRINCEDTNCDDDDGAALLSWSSCFLDPDILHSSITTSSSRAL